MSQRTALYFSSILRKCERLFAVPQAKQCHAQILVHGLSNITLQTDLLLVYSRGGFVQNARKLFDRMVQRNMRSLNILIAAYVENSMHRDAILVYSEFNKMGIQPDHYTLPPMFKACMGLRDVSLGKMFHVLVFKLGFVEYLIVGSSVLEFYVKFGTVEDAEWIFSNMPCRDSIVWNLMISGYGRAAFCSQAMTCFREMLLSGVKMDCMIVPSILNACGSAGDLMKGKEIHGYVVRSFMFNMDAAIGNAMIDMYSRCGCLRDSEKVFKTMNKLNLVTWTALISGYGLHGKGEESLALFKKMINSGYKPNSVTFTAVLASCSHSGLVHQGWKIFNSILLDYGFEPSIEHYACMVDLLGRGGYLVEAFQLLKSMKNAVPASTWGALLSGCMMYRNFEIGEIAAYCLFRLEPKNTSNYIALCTIYESHGMFGAVSELRARMRKLGLVKTPGCSWICISGRVQKFYQGDLSHPLSQKIHKTLNRLVTHTSMDIVNSQVSTK